MLLKIPEIGEWYRTVQDNRFEIVAVDEDSRTIDIQHFDGTLEELDFVDWETSDFRPAGPPEDYSGPLDMEREDLDTDLDRGPSREIIDPLETIEKSK